MKTKKIIIIGAGPLGQEILETIYLLNERASEPIYDCVGFLDDNSTLHDKDILGVKVLGSIDRLFDYPDCYFVCCIGSSKNMTTRYKILNRLNISIHRFESIIHPTAFVSRYSQIGYGSVILANAFIGANNVIGNHVIVKSNSVINHDNEIGDYSIIASGATTAGNVKIGTSSFIGMNSCIRGGVEIGDFTCIGMGSVVLNNVPHQSVYAGNPAKLIRYIH
jgi:sugar O-acyltransferase (sialic acid O-acetyltransferase NeuD family)